MIHLTYTLTNENARHLITTTIIIVYRVVFERKIWYEFELGLRAYFGTFDLFSSFEDSRKCVYCDSCHSWIRMFPWYYFWMCALYRSHVQCSCSYSYSIFMYAVRLFWKKCVWHISISFKPKTYFIVVFVNPPFFFWNRYKVQKKNQNRNIHKSTEMYKRQMVFQFILQLIFMQSQRLIFGITFFHLQIYYEHKANQPSAEHISIIIPYFLHF